MGVPGAGAADRRGGRAAQKGRLSGAERERSGAGSRERGGQSCPAGTGPRRAVGLPQACERP